MSLTQYGFHMVSVVLAVAGMKFNFLFKYSVQQLPDDRLPQGETALSFQSFFSETFLCICFFQDDNKRDFCSVHILMTSKSIIEADAFV